MAERRVLFVLLLFLLLPLQLLYAQPRAKVVFGYASMSSVATTLWVAQEKGFFAKNGLDVQAIFIPGSPTLIEDAEDARALYVLMPMRV